MDIVFNPSPKQFVAWQLLTDHVTTEIGYGGAASGGKSYLGCFWILAMCLTYPGTAWLIGRKQLINLKRTTLLTFFKVCADYDIRPDRDFVYNQQDNTITFHNGSKIFLFDLGYQPSDPLFTRLGGLELTGAFVDESNETLFDAIKILLTRLGRCLNDVYGLLPKLLETFNPDKGHVYSRYYKPDRDGVLPAHRKFIRALPTDNPHTTEDYLNQLRNSDRVTRERLLLGSFEYIADDTALIRYDAIVDLFTNTVERSQERYLVADIARFGSDKTVLTLWEGLHCYQIIYREKQGIHATKEDIKKLAAENTIPYSHIIVDEDGIGGGVVDMLPGIKGFMAARSPFDNATTRQPDNYANLKAQCSYKLAEVVNAHKVAVRTEDTKIREMLTEELEQIKTKDADKDGKRQIMPKERVKEILGRSPDFADCLMMRMYFEFASPSIRIGTGAAHKI